MLCLVYYAGMKEANVEEKTTETLRVSESTYLFEEKLTRSSKNMILTIVIT